MSKFEIKTIDEISYCVHTLSELLASGLNQEQILSEIDELVNSWPLPDHTGNDYGTDEKWVRMMLSAPSFVHLLIKNDDRIVGYWSILPVTKKLFERGVNGDNINRELDEHDIDHILMPGEYYAYFVDLFVYDNYRNNASVISELRKSFLRLLRDYALAGCYFRSIFTNASSPYAIELCKHVGFKETAEHGCHVMLNSANELVPTKIFELSLPTALNSTLFRKRSDVSDLYGEYYKNKKHDNTFMHNVDTTANIIGRPGKINRESFRVEFKQSYKVSSDAHQIISAIAAFLNSDGGVILVGVSDDSVDKVEIKGLVFEDGHTPDKTESSLISKIKDSLGTLAMTDVKFTWEIIDNLTVLRIDCSKSRWPVFMRVGKDYFFYVRFGASKAKLDPEKQAKYCIQHFKP